MITPTNTQSIVLGAGLLGRLLALELLRLGHRVEIFDKADAQGQESAAQVAAAMLAPLAESVITEPSVVKMGHYGLTRWPQMIETLVSPVFFQQNGTLILWHRQDTHEAKRFTAAVMKNQALMNFLDTPQLLDFEQLRQLEPGLSAQLQQGLYLPREGQLDNRQLLSALHDTLVQKGAIFHWNSPVDTVDLVHNETTKSPAAPSVQPIQTISPRDENTWVFDCRGIGAKTAWRELRGVRGEVIRLYAPQVHLSRPVRLIHPRYPIYVAPKEDHVFVIGATEIESDDRSHASVRSTLELLSAAYTLHSGFAEARILEIATQVRPTLSNNLPAVHQSAPRTLHINGLYRHGFLIAPAVVDAVIEFVLGAGHNKAASFGITFSPYTDRT